MSGYLIEGSTTYWLDSILREAKLIEKAKYYEIYFLVIWHPYIK